MSTQELSETVARCVIASAWIKPETRVTDTPEIYKIENVAAPYGFLNGIYRTNLAENDCEKAIRSEYASFKDRSISFRWYVFPHSKPVDLGRRLELLGPSVVVEMQGLFIDRENYPTELPDGVTVEELSSLNLDEYADANVMGWEQKGAQAEKIKSEIKQDFKRGGAGYRGFLARYRGEPAATGLLRLVGETGYLVGGSSGPQFRGKGLYRGLVAHRLGLLKQQKIGRAMVLARKSTSAPICRRLGFQLACECSSFDFNF